MKKFAITLTKGDETTVLETFDSKEAALAAGPEYRKKYAREEGFISCELRDFDENGNMDKSKWRLYDGWR